MSRLSEREIARRLAERDEMEPPAELLARLRDEVPDDVGTRLRLVETAARERKEKEWPSVLSDWRVRLLAASVTAALFGGFLVFEVWREATERVEVTEQEPSAAPITVELGAPRAGRAPAPGKASGGQSTARQAPPPAAMAPPPPAPSSVGAEALDQLAAGDVGSADGERQDLARRPASPALRSRAFSAPAQPVEVPEAMAEGVPGGVAGSVPGGIAGGTIGGVPSPKEAPLRVGRSAMAPTTGGNAEPNDQPYGDVFFKTYGVNPFVDTDDDRLSTFGLDVDTASYTVVRRFLGDRHLPPPEAVRVEEIVNFFSYGDPAPREGDFAIRAEGAPSPFASGERYRLLRFNLRAREIAAADRKPAVLTFVVDVSGSMDEENRLGLVKRALGLLLDELRPEDRVGLVVYGSEGRVLLDHTSDKEAIHRAIDRLVAEGSTNAEEGLVLGYELAERALRRGAINRVILCSDGVANVGATGPDSILARIGRDAERGIELTTVGFGMGNYNDVLMEQLADKGDGRYVYVDDLDEARRVFVEDLTGTLQTVASQARAQVEFNPAVVRSWRLLGYENRDIADNRFRDDTVDAGEIGAGHSVTALYEVKLQEDAPEYLPAAVLRLRWRSERSEQFEETARTLRLADLARSWESAPRGLKLASVVAEFAEILRGSYWAKGGDLGDLARRARRLVAQFPADARVGELATVVQRAAELAGERNRSEQ